MQRITCLSSDFAIGRDQFSPADHGHQTGNGEPEEVLVGRRVAEEERPSNHARKEESEAKSANEESQGNEVLHGVLLGGDAAVFAVQRRAALVIARTADWLDIERPRVVAMVVLSGRRTAVSASLRSRSGQLAFGDGATNLGAGGLVLCGVNGSARKAHLEVRLRALGRLTATDAPDFDHGLCNLEFQTKHALVTALFCSEGAIGQPLNLELPHVWRVLLPLRHSSRLDSQQRREGAGGPDVVNSGLSFHDGR